LSLISFEYSVLPLLVRVVCHDGPSVVIPSPIQSLQALFRFLHAAELYVSETSSLVEHVGSCGMIYLRLSHETKQVIRPWKHNVLDDSMLLALPKDVFLNEDHLLICSYLCQRNNIFKPYHS